MRIRRDCGHITLVDVGNGTSASKAERAFEAQITKCPECAAKDMAEAEAPVAEAEPINAAHFNLDLLDEWHGNTLHIVEFAGYTRGEAWNGWSMPMFERAVAERLMAAMRAHDEVVVRAEYDAHLDAFVIDDGEHGAEGEVHLGFDITLPDGRTAHVYAIGAGTWQWNERGVHYDIPTEAEQGKQAD